MYFLSIWERRGVGKKKKKGHVIIVFESKKIGLLMQTVYTKYLNLYCIWLRTQ